VAGDFTYKLFLAEEIDSAEVSGGVSRDGPSEISFVAGEDFAACFEEPDLRLVCGVRGIVLLGCHL